MYLDVIEGTESTGLSRSVNSGKSDAFITKLWLSRIWGGVPRVAKIFSGFCFLNQCWHCYALYFAFVLLLSACGCSGLRCSLSLSALLPLLPPTFHSSSLPAPVLSFAWVCYYVLFNREARLLDKSNDVNAASRKLSTPQKF